MTSKKADEYDELKRVAKERADIVAKYDKGREEGAQIDPWEDPAFEVYHVTDRYGFIHDHALPAGVDASEHKARQLEMDRTQKWLKMLLENKWEKYFPSEKLSRRVYKGVPDRIRGKVWSKLLKIDRVKAEQNGVYQVIPSVENSRLKKTRQGRREQQGVYQNMRNRARNKSPHIRQIDLDVNRTYRNHTMFRERYGTKQQQLFHVLAAYSMYNTECGYCQGMSEIAALLLMYLNEEDAFWGLSQLLTDKEHAMHGFFIPGFPKLIRFQEHHDAILRKFQPKLRKYLEKYDVYPSLYTIKWFLQCFLDRTPFTLTLRLWDIFMLEGDKLLTGMAYCMMKINKRKLFKMPPDDILVFFQSSLEKNFGFDDDTVIEQLQICMEELRKPKMERPPKAKINELPTLPFGLEIEPSVDQILQRRSYAPDDKYVRNPSRSGKSSHLKKKTQGTLGTPENMKKSGDNRSIQSSRLSEYSMEESSYDTAANSRLSLLDHSSKASMPSSRTSFADTSAEIASIEYSIEIDNIKDEVVDDRSLTPMQVVDIDPLSRDGTLENIAAVDDDDVKPSSELSDYDNVNGMEDYPRRTERVVTQTIPISKSDGFVSNRTERTDNIWLNGYRHEMNMQNQSGTSQTTGEVVHSDTREVIEHHNGYVVERQRQAVVESRSTTSTTRTVHKQHVQQVQRLTRV